MNFSQKINALQNLLKNKNIDAWIVPSSDPHQSEYVAEHWKSRQWLSGFTGSAGTVVVTQNRAGLWTDTRYFLQAEKELKNSGIDLFKIGLPDVPSFTKWLASELGDNATIAFDGKLLSINQVKGLLNEFGTERINLFYEEDLLDQIWRDRPAIPNNKVIIYDIKFSGESRQSKINRVLTKMKETNAQYHLLSTLDDIAWTLNIRGTDIDFNPLVICYAIISEKEIRLFINNEKLNPDILNSFNKDNIKISDYNNIFSYLNELQPETSILIDPDKTSYSIEKSINKNCTIQTGTNIAYLMKCCKNEIEIQGFRDAHICDGVAMVKWLYWFENTLGKEVLTEISIAEKLESFRKQDEKYKGPSFRTIAGYKGNGAIVHYSATKESALELTNDGLLLLDSGGQYQNGTTDITRTIALGKPTEEEKSCFTLVLKGHIDLAMAQFPEGTSGSQIDTFSRAHLWQVGLNYGHGTGHGVGHYLNVHEGPHQIRPNNHVPIKLGMVISNEPGIYFEDKFGIRIENLILTVLKAKNEFGTFFGFEILTFCPIDINLIEVGMLSIEERAWLNAYHQIVYMKLYPFLEPNIQKWLKKKTKKI